jgi:hypothetical protein
MANQQVVFGRRGVAPRPAAHAAKAATAPRDMAAERLAAPAAAPAGAPRDPLDGELRAWKRARRRNFRLPWRQVSLMATLCFGIGAFVLPSSVNGAVQWLLYTLMGASLYAGFRRRRRGA